MSSPTNIEEISLEDQVQRAEGYERFQQLRSETQRIWELEVDESNYRSFNLDTQNGIQYQIISIPFDTGSSDIVAGIRVIFKEGLPLETSASWVNYQDHTEVEMKYATVDATGETEFYTDSIGVPLSASRLSGLKPSFTLNKCRACIKVANVIKQYGCDLSIGVICALAGLPVIPGVICAIIVIPLCALYRRANQNLSARQLCQRANLCP